MFGMARDLGRKKQERQRSSNRLPKGAYSMDKRLVPRVKEYLNQFRKGYQPDIEDVVNHLQTRYSEYSRRKRRAFKLSVEKVYDAIFKEREEDKHLQELEERFLEKRKNSPDLRIAAKKPENRKFVRRKSELPHDSKTVNALSDYNSPEEYLTSAPET